MPSDCTFSFDRATPIYYSGETVAGTITLKTTSDKNVRDVSIIFLGEGKVKWNESHSTRNSDGSTSTNTTNYRSHETYIENSTTVHWGGVLQVGTYTYTFNILLPWQCPTSCEGKYGYVRYEIALKINRYLRFDNVYKKPITIIKTEDLNLNPIYRLPLEMETVSTSCCSCFRANSNIWFNLRIPFGAYAPGQKVNYALHIANQSMDDCEGYRMEFIQKIIFTAKSPHRKQRNSINVLTSRSYLDKCLRLTNCILKGEFIIPAIPPTTERSCIICVEYTLRVTVHLPCCRSDPELRVPIIIGTIPIRESLNTDQLVSTNEQQQILPTAPELSTPNDNQVNNDPNAPPSYNEIKPPTFEQATRSHSPFIDTDVDEANRIVGFQPLYPMYNTFSKN